MSDLELEENGYSDNEEVNVAKHARLLEDVFQLDKKQFVKKPTRTEPTSHVSEFNLVKTNSGKQCTVHIGDLTKSLEKLKKHVDVSKKIKSAQTGVLRKPLEKPQRERIKRSVGFKEIKSDLEKWDPIVIKNRVTSQLQFPLDQGEITIHKGKPEGFKLKLKSKLDEELEKLEPPNEKDENDKIETFPLTLKEIMEKRREMARLRAQQSYQESKYRRQSKIKSKKFHRIARKEKIKTQIKEFETLQKTDPEEALKRLEEIERARAEERMSLRHKSTGQWAKNKVVRAKYDKESRQNLAQQLAISRELTQKLRTESSSESENEDQIVIKNNDGSNPWTSDKTDQEIDSFLNGYRKFWEGQNKATPQKQNGHHDEKNSDSEEEKSTDNENEPQTTQIQQNGHDEEESSVEEVNEPQTKRTQQSNAKLIRKKSPKKVNLNSTSEWEVEEVNESKKEESLEEIFEDFDSITHNEVSKKLNKLKSSLEVENVGVETKKKSSKKDKRKSKKTSNYMELPREKYRPELDEELIMEDEVQRPKLRKLIEASAVADADATEKNSDIDPNKYLNLIPTHLDTFIPNNIEVGDDSDEEGNENGQRDIITEAFAGDDCVSEFVKEKKDVIDSEKPEDVDLTLPGWGSWGGKNIKPSKRKRKRFIVKFPKKLPRRDENKGHVVINEKKNEKLEKHMVTEVPFPFKSVKEFEASIRAPIGDTFVPQTAFRRYIKPAVVTKKGEVIKPMDEQVLVKHKFTKKGNVVKV